MLICAYAPKMKLNEIENPERRSKNQVGKMKWTEPNTCVAGKYSSCRNILKIFRWLTTFFFRAVVLMLLPFFIAEGYTFFIKHFCFSFLSIYLFTYLIEFICRNCQVTHIWVIWSWIAIISPVFSLFLFLHQTTTAASNCSRCLWKLDCTTW